MPLSMPCQPGGAEASALPDPSCALSLQSKGSLEVTESQSADAEPPPPPKPDLSRYTGLRTHLTLATTEGKEGIRALAAAGRGAQGCTRQARSQGHRADLEHIGIPGPVYVAPCTWRSLRDAHSQLCSAGGQASMALSGATGSCALQLPHCQDGGGEVVVGLAQQRRASVAGSVWAWPEVGCDGQSLWQLLSAAAGDPTALLAMPGRCCLAMLPAEGCGVCVSH